MPIFPKCANIGAVFWATVMQELTADEKSELLQELEDHRELKKKGARASSISAAQDMRFTIQHLSQEVSLRLSAYRSN